jgi:hypothetical protein
MSSHDSLEGAISATVFPAIQISTAPGLTRPTNERPRRTDFCTDMPKHLEGDSLLLDRIVFSGEATFQLSGNVNRHNIVIWGSQNPHQIVEHVRESYGKLFCAVIRTQGVKGVVCGLEGIRLADRCILSKLE